MIDRDMICHEKTEGTIDVDWSDKGFDILLEGNGAKKVNPSHFEAECWLTFKEIKEFIPNN